MKPLITIEVSDEGVETYDFVGCLILMFAVFCVITLILQVLGVL